MRAELRRLHSPDLSDLSLWSPSESSAVLVQLMVGPAGSPGEESFEVTLCTAGWLGERAEVEGIVDCRHHVMVTEYDYLAIEQYFQRRVAACEGETWREVAEKVGRLGRWEFEDYSE